MSNKRDRLESLLSNLIGEAENYNDLKIAEIRDKAYQYYYGQLPAARKNSPKIVKKIVFDKVRQALSQIKEPFLSSQDVMSFTPIRQDQAQDARIASDLVNKALRIDNNFDTVLDSVIFNGLLCKVGILKASWKDKSEFEEESFEDISSEALDSLLSEDNVELIEEEVIRPEFSMEAMMSILPALPPEVQQYLMDNYEDERAFINSLDDYSFKALTKALPSSKEIVDIYIDSYSTYSGTISREIDTSSVEIKSVSPENFLINEGAMSIKESYFVAERYRATSSDLLDMDFDEALLAEAMDKGTSTLTNTDMVKNSIDGTFNQGSNGNYYDLYECYVETSLVEHDEEDNKTARAKLYQMYYLNGVLLEESEVDARPFFGWTPITIPDKFYGQSMAEVLFDEQDAATYAIRGGLQYLAFSTNPRYKAVDNAEYNLAAFQANIPGSVVPVTKGDLVPFEYPQLDQSIFTVVDSMSRSADSSSGVSDMSAGLSPDALRSNVAAATVAMTQDASSRRVKDYARNLASQCLKDAYSHIYTLIRKNSEDYITIFNNGASYEVDPQRLSPKLVVFIDPAISRYEKAEHNLNLMATKSRIENTETLKELQSMEQAYNLEQDIMKSSGVYDTDRYLTKPQPDMIKPSSAAEKQQAELTQQQQAMQEENLRIQNLELEYLSRQLQTDAENKLARQELDQERLRFEEEKAADAANRADRELELKERDMVIKEEDQALKTQVAADKTLIEEAKVENDALRTASDIINK